MKDEIAEDIAWSESAKKDFAEALSNAAAEELNRRNIGAGKSHLLTLAIAGGELAVAHFAVGDRIHKAILEASRLKATPPPGTSPEQPQMGGAS